jgi:hypothetical protein
MFFHMAEYCDTLQSKVKRNREYKACLNERALRLLDQRVTMSIVVSLAFEKCVMSLYVYFCLRQFCLPLFCFFWFVPGFVEVD